MNAPSRQHIAVIAIVVIGAVLTAGVLYGRPRGGGEDAPRSPAASAPADAGHAERNDRGDEHAEDRIAIDDAQQTAAGIEVRTAGPARLQTAVDFTGEIRFNDDRTAHVVPRLSGVAEAVRVTLGQEVTQGQVLAVIASTAIAEQRSELLTAQARRDAAKVTYERERRLWLDRISAEQDQLQAKAVLGEAEIAVRNASQKLAAVGAHATSTALNRFEVRAPFAGTVVEKHLSLGEAVKEDGTVFMISDLRSVWAEFAIAPKDLAAVRVGQKVLVSSTAFDERVPGTISYIGALLGEQTRTARARVTLANPNGAWRPGLFVTVSVLGEDQEVAVAVAAGAVQTVEGQASVFVDAAGGFERRTVRVGRVDGTTAEVLSGIAPGDRYAATGTFILKSDLGKSGAEHGH